MGYAEDVLQPQAIRELAVLKDDFPQALETAEQDTADLALLDDLLIAPSLLDDAPARLREQFYQAFGIELLYN